MGDKSLPPNRLTDRLFAYSQFFFPQRLITACMYRATRIRNRRFKDAQIAWFIRRYRVDMDIADPSDPRQYHDFNAFFTRELRAGARPLGRPDDAVVCPADGEISQIGMIEDGRLLQAKDRHFTATDLLGGPLSRGAPLREGKFATIYLSPRDYHRVHMPAHGHLREMIYIPGQLFSVNQGTTHTIENLFARNERVVFRFDAPSGPFALVMVGAMCVASIETVWAGEITPAKKRRSRVWRYGDDGEPEVSLKRGEELGRFNMGSTVIILWPDEAVSWDAVIGPGQAVKMGQPIGRIANTP